jgi:hypothetical protein
VRQFYNHLRASVVRDFKCSFDMSINKLIIGILVTLVIFIAYFFVVTEYFLTSSEQGQFGDMFGALNAFFTGLAFVGLIYTLFQQNEMIKLTNIQSKLSKKEYDADIRIKALTLLIEINQKKYEEIKNINHLEANEIRKKVLLFTTELERFLITS